MIESKLLSKVLDEKNFFVLKKYNVTKDDFVNYPDVYAFIESYVKRYGHTPDYRTVVEEFDEFDYLGEVADAFGYLCRELKTRRGIRESYHFLTKEVPKLFENGKNKNFLEQLKTEVENIYNVSSSVSQAGSNYANNGMERLQRYEDNKKNRNHVIVPTPYKQLNEVLQLELTDYLLLQAFSNVGKSWIASDLGVHAWRNKFGVLHYSPELSLAQQEARNDTLIGHFNNMAIRNGKLNNEEDYKQFLQKFKDNDTPYIIKTMEHLPEGLTLDIIEADIQQNENIQVVIIDGFNLITHGKGKLDRNAMTQTSRRLRQIFGRYNVLGIVVHQVNAEEEKSNKKKDDEEFAERVPKPASILGYSETIAVIQDASHVISFDAVDGMGAMQLVKTRGTGKDTIIEFKIDFNSGIIEEVTPTDVF